MKKMAHPQNTAIVFSFRCEDAYSRFAVALPITDDKMFARVDPFHKPRVTQASDVEILNGVQVPLESVFGIRIQ